MSVEAPKPLRVSIPLRVVSEANDHSYWRVRQKRAKAQRGLVAAYMRHLELPPLPATVLMTRIAPRMLDSGDNLSMAFKHVKDEIAALYDVNDRSDLYDWKCQQERGKDYSIRVEITPLADLAETRAGAAGEGTE